jgi:FdhD protein
MKRSIVSVPIRKIDGAAAAPAQDLLAVEEPLEIIVNGRNVAITMRTPGNDAELACGFLFTEGIFCDPPQEIVNKGNRIEISSSAKIDLDRLERHFYLSSSCGVCGKASIDALESIGCPFLNHDRPRIDANLIEKLPEALRERQSVFDRTGGLHAAAIFDTAGNLVDLREDVGRHNALDKLIGAAFLQSRTPLDAYVLMLSGRASFELIQKALMAGVAIVAAVGAPSSLAVETALRYDMTLCGFVRPGRFNIYCGEGRVNFSSAPPSGSPNS